MSYEIDGLMTTFRDRETERTYQGSIADSNWRVNNLAMAVFLPVYTIYVFLDAFFMADHDQAVLIRITSVWISGLMFIFCWAFRLRSLHRDFCVAILFVLTIATCLLIRKQPELLHAQYDSIIFMAIFCCFLLRLGFLRPLISMAVMFIGFYWAVSNKPNPEQALSEATVLLSVLASCAFALYFQQRLRRDGFINNNVIQRQNEKLQNLLERVEAENVTKTAMTNILVHHMRNPVHQIIGYTDLMLNKPKSDNPAPAALAGVDIFEDGAVRIRSAATTLVSNINRLVQYHRLDELQDNMGDPTSWEEVFCDFDAEIERDIEYVFSGDRGVTSGSEVILNFSRALSSYYNIEQEDVSRLKVFSGTSLQGDQIIIEDNGAVKGEEAFDEECKPLSQIETYLQAQGEYWPLSLRALARLAEMVNGHFIYQPLAAGNRYIFSLPHTPMKPLSACV